MTEAGRRCLLLKGDVADAAFCARAVGDAAGAFGRLDILVNNAAIQVREEGEGGVVGSPLRAPPSSAYPATLCPHHPHSPTAYRAQYEEPALEELDLGRARRVFDVNVLSNLALCKAALPHFGQQGGGVSGSGSGGDGDTTSTTPAPASFTGCSVIFCTSINAAGGHPTLLSYTATKGAQQSLVRSLAKALVGRGVRINAVSGGSGEGWSGLWGMGRGGCRYRCAHPFAASTAPRSLYPPARPPGRTQVAPGPVWTPLNSGSFSED